MSASIQDQDRPTATSRIVGRWCVSLTGSDRGTSENLRGVVQSRRRGTNRPCLGQRHSPQELGPDECQTGRCQGLRRRAAAGAQGLRPGFLSSFRRANERFADRGGRTPRTCDASLDGCSVKWPTIRWGVGAFVNHVRWTECIHRNVRRCCCTCLSNLHRTARSHIERLTCTIQPCHFHP
jgi:hypothetical protein